MERSRIDEGFTANINNEDGLNDDEKCSIYGNSCSELIDDGDLIFAKSRACIVRL